MLHEMRNEIMLSDDYFGSWRRGVRHSLFIENFMN